jgi:parallel beta-helix repeat protein
MTASGTVIHIPGDYPTIQQGIDSCAIFDTVLVAEGIYFENIFIYSPISLIGEDRDSTIIDGSGAGDVIYIDAWGVLIRGFTIKNSGVNYEDAGVELSFTDSCAIEGCNFEDNYAGLSLYGSGYNLIARSRFSGNARGIHFREDPDMTAPDNFRNAIQNNIIENQDLIAILFEHTYMTFHNSNVIIGNRIFNNELGVFAVMSEDNVISYNDIVGNNLHGAWHNTCMCGGEHNQFHHNNFIEKFHSILLRQKTFSQQY